MVENLFLQSFQHLFTPEQKKEVLEQRLDPVSIVIALDKGRVFKTVEEACTYLIELPKDELPEGFRNTISKSLIRGDPEKQIASIFKDFKRYGKQVLPKLISFFQYLNQNRGSYLKYVERLGKDLSPMECLENGRIDLVYFKLWFLFNYIKTNSTT